MSGYRAIEIPDYFDLVPGTSLNKDAVVFLDALLSQNCSVASAAQYVANLSGALQTYSFDPSQFALRCRGNGLD